MSGAIDNEFERRIVPMLEGIEKLRASQEDNAEVSVPGVVVIGAQSAGKSSVLEAIAGIKLPRGQNITTRVPLILSLQGVPGSPPKAVIGSNADASNNNEIDIDHVGDAIEALTTELAGDGAAVSQTPIYCRVTRASGPTLTLIDLPGITHICADESQDIHTQTVSLVTKYIENKNMVILVVIPAMDDFANSEAVSLARKYDPDGSRTLGVVTKMDNIQPGCRITEKLRMEQGQVQLRLGFIAVINRTPLEVESDTPAEYVRARERHFFKINSEVAGLEREFWGLHTLVDRIVSIQMERVQEFVPSFIRNAIVRSRQIRTELNKLPRMFTSDTQRRDAFHKVISAIRQELREILVNGHGTAICKDNKSSLNVVPNVVSMYKKYADSIIKEVIPDFFSDDYYEKASASVKSVDGMVLSNLRAGRVANPLIREVFEEELAPRAEDLVSEVRDYMQKVVSELCESACADYPPLLDEMKTALVDEYMEFKESETKVAVLNVCNAELGWFFTQNPAYDKMLKVLGDAVTSARESEAVRVATAQHGIETDELQVETVGDVPQGFIQKMISCVSKSNEDDVRTLQVTLSTYVNVVCKNIFDTVPKQVQYCLVTGTCDGLEDWMLGNVSTEDLGRLFVEDSQSQRKRKEMERKLAQFEEGLKILRDASI